MPEVLNIVLRAIGFFFLTFLLVRLLGKRLSTQLTTFDQINLIVIGAIAAVTTINLNINPGYGVAALAMWVILPVSVYYLSLKSKTVRDIVQGKETILINNGKVLEDQLMRARFSPEDLLSQLRRKNAFKVADVEFAMLEPNGEVSVLLKKDKQPLTPGLSGLKVSQESVPQTVMLDGEILDEPLAAIGLNRNWLHTELEKLGVAPENVFIAQVDSLGQLYLDLFNDAIILPQPKTKELVFATLKKCQADCELYALGTKQPQAKTMYGENAKKLDMVIRNLEPLLKR